MSGAAVVSPLPRGGSRRGALPRWALGAAAAAVLLAAAGGAWWLGARDAVGGTYVQHQVARIYVVLGERDAALDQLEPLLRMPYYLTPAWLRLDPTLAPLRGHPRFERLAAGR